MNKLKICILIVIVFFVTVITFFGNYNLYLKEIESTVKTEQTQINRYIDLSQGFINLLVIHSEETLKQSPAIDSELYQYLEYSSRANTYNLDAVFGTKYQSNYGNITGIGKIPENGIEKDEINLALNISEQFSSIYKKLPDVAWIYYTSSNNFILLYPWVSSSDFAFDESLLKEVFYTIATPENNQLREALWTPVYMDHAGKGLMVTLSKPIYNNDVFVGVISIDLTNDKLSEMIKSEYEIYIIDDTDSVIANSRNLINADNVPKFNEVLKTSVNKAEDIKSIKNNEIEIIDGYYTYSIVFNDAPWRLFIRISMLSITLKSFIYTLPLMFICILLLLTFFQIERRKRVEIDLKNSLEELTSYQKLLEKAAKYDFLTSTVNRRGLMDIFNDEVLKNIKNTSPICFIMGDIDHFKRFNDTYGHYAGDKVLVEITKIMQSCIKNDEVVCRWGGEEFIIMLIKRDYNTALQVAEHIRLEIENMIIPWENSIELKATMTFGVIEFNQKETFESNISILDSALYFGKNSGRNKVVGSIECDLTV
ncbi:MAG: hypothetical protein A2Y17_06710 [Clostridiales bacterium GWF2_38_85]|nr:MAG: hypothetical protein A2Y17_06710 [Clostridiales bacterium GWF2_38_85]HBL84906.1 hypothetical protein [Clostridiales bacterium]